MICLKVFFFLLFITSSSAAVGGVICCAPYCINTILSDCPQWGSPWAFITFPFFFNCVLNRNLTFDACFYGVCMENDGTCTEANNYTLAAIECANRYGAWVPDQNATCPTGTMNRSCLFPPGAYGTTCGATFSYNLPLNVFDHLAISIDNITTISNALTLSNTTFFIRAPLLLSATLTMASNSSLSIQSPDASLFVSGNFTMDRTTRLTISYWATPTITGAPLRILGCADFGNATLLIEDLPNITDINASQPTSASIPLIQYQCLTQEAASLPNETLSPSGYTLIYSATGLFAVFSLDDATSSSSSSSSNPFDNPLILWATIVAGSVLFVCIGVTLVLFLHPVTRRKIFPFAARQRFVPHSQRALHATA